jgi:hypothetical protein
VKFAKVTPSQDELELLFAKASELVQQSQPRTAAAVSAAPTAGAGAP